MSGRHEWSLFARDTSYRLLGGIRLSSAKAVIRHLATDTAVIETPYSEQAFDWTEPGAGMVLYRDGLAQFSGLVASERTLGWDATAGSPTIKVSLLGDNVHLEDRIAWPDPAKTGDGTTTYDYWYPRDGAGAIQTVAGSTAIWRAINEHLGPGARAERRVPGLTMGTDPVVGIVRIYRSLWDSVLKCAQVFSVVSGSDVGVRFVPVAGGVRVDMYEPRDLTGDVRFSADLGNLIGFEYTEKAPALTYAIALGQGDLHLRTRKASQTTDPLNTRWGRRIERVVDRRDEADLTLLQQAADDEITQGTGQISLVVTLTDTQAATYGTDWGLGDRVTVYVGLPGQTKPAVVTDVVREIAFEVNNVGAETIRPAVGTTDAKALQPGPTQQALAQVGYRLQQLIAR